MCNVDVIPHAQGLGLQVARNSTYIGRGGTVAGSVPCVRSVASSNRTLITLGKSFGYCDQLFILLSRFLNCPLSLHTIHAWCVALAACVPADIMSYCCFGFALHSWLCSVILGYHAVPCFCLWICPSAMTSHFFSLASGPPGRVLHVSY